MHACILKQGVITEFAFYLRVTFSGFIDCGQLACADRHRDIAQSAWSIGYNLGEQWVTPFLRLYGRVDEEKMAVYARLEGLA